MSLSNPLHWCILIGKRALLCPTSQPSWYVNKLQDAMFYKRYQHVSLIFLFRCIVTGAIYLFFLVVIFSWWVIMPDNAAIIIITIAVLLLIHIGECPNSWPGDFAFESLLMPLFIVALSCLKLTRSPRWAV